VYYNFSGVEAQSHVVLAATVFIILFIHPTWHQFLRLYANYHLQQELMNVYYE